MSTSERAADLGRFKARRLALHMGEEIRLTRVGAGISLRDLGRAARLSHTQLGRLERGEIANLSIDELGRCAAALGLDLSVRLYPVGDPLRDRAHQALLERLKGRVSPTLRWRTEVPLALAADRRAWDAVIDGFEVPAGACVAVEAETRVSDAQALERRLSLKRRDGDAETVLLLISDTRWNRNVVPLLRSALAAAMPLGNAQMLVPLASGRHPDGSGIVLL